MKEFTIVCGLSGSGKSTFANTYKKNLESEGYKVIFLSSDNLREELYGDINDQAHNREVFQYIHNAITAWAKTTDEEDSILIVDATNLTRKDRMAMIHSLGKFKSKIRATITVMAVPFNECVENDSNRDRHVGKEVIFKQMCRFEMPQKYEGWDSIHVKSKSFDFDYRSDAELMSKMIGLSQNNPHHKYTLFEHNMKVMYEAILNKASTEAVIAAKYHDVGKLFTQTIDDKGVSHYYNHANVSTYYMLVNSHLFYQTDSRLEDPLFTLFLINYHMLIRDIEKNCATKYRKLWGDEWYDALVRFSKYDEAASGLTAKQHSELTKPKIDEILDAKKHL